MNISTTDFTVRVRVTIIIKVRNIVRVRVKVRVRVSAIFRDIFVSRFISLTELHFSTIHIYG